MQVSSKIKSRFSSGILFMFITALCTFTAPAPAPGLTKPISGESDYTIGLKAYMYAYPIVLLETQRIWSQYKTNVLYPQRTFADPSAKQIVGPNVDTLYTYGYLNLAQGPVTLTVPDMGNRFYLIQLMDWWTDTFADMGTRTTGNARQKFTIVGPDYTGAIPPNNLTIIKAPTNRVWLFGRIFCDGSAADVKIVNQLQDKMHLTRSGAAASESVSLAGADDDELMAGQMTSDPALTPPQIVAQMSAETFFETFARLLKKNKPHAGDWPMLALLSKIGIHCSRPFYFSNLSPDTQAALTSAVPDALQIISTQIPKIEPGYVVGTWKYTTMFGGSFGDSYAYRADKAMHGIGGNLSEDNSYAGVTISLNGSANSYTIHFADGQLPPVNGFWSITLYDANVYLYPNAINKYAIRSADSLVKNPDGSIDLYIQNQPPADPALAAHNWLPCPAAKFLMYVRMYWPKTDVIYGTSTWSMPPVVVH